MFHKTFPILICCILSMFVSACTNVGGVGLSYVSSIPGGGQEKQATKTEDRTQERAYRLGPGDKLDVTVDGVKDHSGVFDIKGDGKVSMPFIGNISAGGLTLPEFETQLRKSLKSYVRNPQVRVTVSNYRPFYIQGEVRQGGQYDYREGLDVRRAVAVAGGYTYRAVKDYVFIQRAGHGQEQKYSLNSPVFIRPGDNIRIPERFF